jgi:hypothetical protein
MLTSGIISEFVPRPAMRKRPLAAILPAANHREA